MRLWALANICNEGGTAYNCHVLRPLQSERLQGIFFLCALAYREDVADATALGAASLPKADSIVALSQE